MNYRTMVKGALAFSLSLIVGSAWATDTQTYGVTFEPTVVENQNDFPYTLGDGITNAKYRVTENVEVPYGWLAAAEDESKIIERVAEGSTQALQLNTESNTLTNKFASGVATTVNTAIANQGTAFFETEVKFVASDTLDAGIAGGTDATKFAIYAYSNDTPPEGENCTTNLVVFHAYVDGNGNIDYTNEVFKSVIIDTEVYTKLRVEMKQLDAGTDGMMNVFSVSINGGEPISSDTAFDAYLNETATGSWFLTTEKFENDTNKQVSSLNFKGTGEIDNIKVGTIENYVPDSNWKIQGLNPRGEWTDPTIVAADGKTLFYSNLTVKVDAAGTERPIDAAWIGVSVIAPETVTSENIGTWLFDVKGNGNTLATGVSFSTVQAQDGFVTNNLYAMNQWFGLTPSNVRSAIAEQRSIIYTFDFYQQNDSENKQTLTIDISPKNIEIDANGVEGAIDIKVVDWIEFFAVSWTIDNVTVTTNAQAAAAGDFAKNTQIVFTPDQGMAITNIDGVAVNYAADAAFTLNVTQSTNITVKAGTVSSERVMPDWAKAADAAKFWKWVDDNNVSDYASTDYTAQYLMNVDETANPVLKIDSIEVTDEGSKIVISAADGNTAIDLAAINGVLNVSVGSKVSELTSKAIPAANKPEAAANKVAVIILSTDGAFAKATVDFTAAGSSLSEVQQQ